MSSKNKWGRMSPIPRASPRSPSEDDAPTNETPAVPQPSIARSKKLSCPFCGERQSSPSNLWRHKAAECPKNTNPACSFCGWRYKPAELERHRERCEWKDAPKTMKGAAQETAHGAAERTTKRARITTNEPKAQTMAPRVDADGPDHDHATPSLPPDDDLGDDGGGADMEQAGPSSSELDPNAPNARDALSEAVLGERPANEAPRAAKATLLTPDEVAIIRLWRGVSPPPRDAEFLADLYRSVLFLHAKGYIQPASGQEGEAMWDRYVDKLEPNLTEEQMDELSEVSHEWHPQVRGLLGAAFQPPPAPKVSYSQGFLIGCIGFFLGALMAYSGYKAREKRALAQTQASAALSPAYRPPYNPAEHGSVETYRLAFGHLPPSPSAPAAEPERLGLDERKRRRW